MKTTGTCKLCLQNKGLCCSHIIPDLFIRFIGQQKPTGSKGKEQPFVTLIPTKKESPIIERQGGSWEHMCGIKEELLCLECESKLNVWETYVRTLLYGTGKIPKRPSFTRNPLPSKLQTLYFDALETVTVDYHKFKLFQLSLLWRAGVSKGDLWKKVSLGDKHEEKLRLMLYNENPGEWYEYPCQMTFLESKKGLDCNKVIEAPEQLRNRGSYHYRFILGGYGWLFDVSSHVREESDYAFGAVKKDGSLNILVGNADGLVGSRWAKDIQKHPTK